MALARSRLLLAVLLAGGAALSSGCSRTAADTRAPDSKKFDRIDRLAFNRRAVELDQPLFWRSDANGDGALEPNELVVTWRHVPLARTKLVDGNNEFTPELRAIYERMLRPDDTSALAPAERRRREAVRLELSQGQPALVESDFSGASDAEKRLVARLLRAAVVIDHLYARQKGTAGLEGGIPRDDPASAAMFFRNHGPFCGAPRTGNDPACRALPEPVKRLSGLYPAEIQDDKSFCGLLQRQRNAAQLADHFSAVVRGNFPDSFRSVKYSDAYEDDMKAVAQELEAAARELDDGEAALNRYLSAAAKAFRDNDWEAANEAWVAMGDGRSKYYLRVGPDEVLLDPCGWKAAFAFAFARINQASLEWRRRLEPIKQELENELARLAGPPYRARTVRFKLPDFIDIVLNAGDNRWPLGAAGGQSLPNWGPWVEKGGRTMIMSNVDVDADSQKALLTRMSSLCCHATTARVSADPKLEIMATVLHEAAHNLGPTREHRVGSRLDQVVFGGPLALLLEELKAETAAIYLPAELVRRKLLPQKAADLARILDVGYDFGLISQGMYDPEGRPLPYGQVSSIVLGTLWRAGVLEWRAGETAGNAKDQGCFELHEDRWQAAVTPLVQQVLQIKSRGDRRGAERLVTEWVDGDKDWKKLRKIITERWLREPRRSLVFSLGGL